MEITRSVLDGNIPHEGTTEFRVSLASETCQSDYLETAKLAHSLGLKSQWEYREACSGDTRLPAHPEVLFGNEWGGWKFFLNGRGKPYDTLEEAMQAVRRLGICRRDVYLKRYKEDVRLSSKPNIVYREVWQGWEKFLGIDFYETIEEASAAAANLGIRTMAEYRKRYKEDLRLPCVPSVIYANEWVNWKVYLQTRGAPYSSLQEAAEAARALGIKSQRKYQVLYLQDKRLVSNPNSKYESEWESWESFLNIPIYGGRSRMTPL